VLVGHRQYPLHVQRLPEDVSDADGPGVWRDAGLDLFGTDVVAVGRGVGHDRDVPRQGHRHLAARIGDRADDHLRERFEVEGAHGDVHRRRAGVDGVGVPAAHELRERLAVRLLPGPVVPEGLALLDGLVEEVHHGVSLLGAEQAAGGERLRPHRRPAVDRQALSAHGSLPISPISRPAFDSTGAQSGSSTPRSPRSHRSTTTGSATVRTASTVNPRPTCRF